MFRKENRRYILLGVCLIALTVLVTWIGVMNANNELERTETKLVEITSSNEKAQKEVDAAREAYQSKLASASLSNVGTNAARIAEDAAFITEIIKPAYSWRSDNDYTSARDAIEKHIGKDNAFMEEIMPDLAEEHVSLDSQDLNMKCMDISVLPAKSVKGKAAYYAIVEYIQYFNKDIEKQDHLTRNRQALHIVMDSSEKIKSIEAVDLDDIRVYDTGNNG